MGEEMKMELKKRYDKYELINEMLKWEAFLKYTLDKVISSPSEVPEILRMQWEAVRKRIRVS